jgi:hypothetical protein
LQPCSPLIKERDSLKTAIQTGCFRGALAVHSLL